MNPINQLIRRILIFLGVLIGLTGLYFAIFADFRNNSGIDSVLLLILILTVISGYFLPAFNAIRISHPNYLIILILNATLAWTGIGWILVMIWSCYPPNNPRATQAPAGKSLKQHLLEVERLRRDNLLSEDEARSHRARLLAGVTGESLADRLKVLRDLRDARVITIPEHDEARTLLV